METTHELQGVLRRLVKVLGLWTSLIPISFVQHALLKKCKRHQLVHERTRSDALQLISACSHLAEGEPFQFVMFELHFAVLLNLSSMRHFVNRYNMMSCSINSKLVSVVTSSLPLSLQTDLIVNDIYSFVGGDFFISCCEHDAGSFFGVIDHTGKLICKLSDYFNEILESSAFFIDDSCIAPVIYATSGAQLLRWTMDEQKQLLIPDTSFNEASLVTETLSSRYWHPDDSSRGVAIWRSSLFIASEEHEHVSNRTSSENILRVIISKMDTSANTVCRKYSIDFHRTANTPLRNLDCDFAVASSAWLSNTEASTSSYAFCFVLFERHKQTVNFVDPSGCAITRQIKIKGTRSYLMRILFANNDRCGGNRMFAYSVCSSVDTKHRPFISVVDIHGNVKREHEFPRGGEIKFVSVTLHFLYVDVKLQLSSIVGSLPSFGSKEKKSCLYNMKPPRQLLTTSPQRDTWRMYRYVMHLDDLEVLAIFPAQGERRDQRKLIHLCDLNTFDM